MLNVMSLIKSQRCRGQPAGVNTGCISAPDYNLQPSDEHKRHIINGSHDESLRGEAKHQNKDSLCVSPEQTSESFPRGTVCLFYKRPCVHYCH